MKVEILDRKGCIIIGKVIEGSKLAQFNGKIYIMHPQEKVKWIINNAIEDVPMFENEKMSMTKAEYEEMVKRRPNWR